MLGNSAPGYPSTTPLPSSACACLAFTTPQPNSHPSLASSPDMLFPLQSLHLAKSLIFSPVVWNLELMSSSPSMAESTALYLLASHGCLLEYTLQLSEQRLEYGGLVASVAPEVRWAAPKWASLQAASSVVLIYPFLLQHQAHVQDLSPIRDWADSLTAAFRADPDDGSICPVPQFSHQNVSKGAEGPEGPEGPDILCG